MALTYRSPIEEVLTTFTSVEQSSIALPAVKAYKDYESEHFALFNYALPALAKQRIIDSGIYLSPYSAVPHSHPVCKTLENYLLYKVLPSYLDSSFFFVGIKQSKLHFLKKRVKNLSTVKAINRFVTSADKMRYSDEFSYRAGATGVTSKSGFDNNLGVTLEGLVPEALKHKAMNLFLHDEIHYWNDKDIKTFLHACKPNVVLATCVFPPELLMGAKRSFNPWCYDFEIQGSNFFYYPDGQRSEHYFQPIHGGLLLKTNCIKLEDGTTYGVDLIHSKFSHHLVAITRGQAVNREFNAFSNFEATSVKLLRPICPMVEDCIPIAHSTIRKIYCYLRTLNKPDMQSAMAKLNQISHDPSGFEITFMQDFSKLVIDHKTEQVRFLNDPMGAIMKFLITNAPAGVGRFFSKFASLTLGNFMSSLEPLTFKIKLQQLDEVRDILPNRQISSEDCDAAFQSLDRFSEVEWEFNRRRQPYACAVPMVDELRVNVDFLMRLALAYFKRSHVSEHAFFFSIRRLRDSFEAFLKKIGFCSLLCSYLDLDFYEKVQKKLWAINIRHHRYLFAAWHFSGEWFLCGGAMRRNQRYLEGPEAGHGLFMAVGQYKNVIAELMLKRSVLELDTHVEARGSEIPEAGVAHGDDHTPMVHEVSKSEGTQIGLEEQLKLAAAPVHPFVCKCKQELLRGNAIGLDLLHLDFPDKLRGRRGGWYSKDESSYAYNGGAHKSLGWDESLDLLLEVNGFEPGRFDCMLAQQYEQGGKIGFHSDDEEIFKKGGEVLTFCCAGSCNFQIKCSEGVSGMTFRRGCWLLMPAGFQEDHKHAVSDCSAGRVSLTFRQLKAWGREISETEDSESLAGENVEIAEEVKFASLYDVSVDIVMCQPLIKYREVAVPGDGDCFWHSLGFCLGLDGPFLKETLHKRYKAELPASQQIDYQFGNKIFAENEVIVAAVRLLGLHLEIILSDAGHAIKYFVEEPEVFVTLLARDKHFTPLQPINDCVVASLAKAVQREPSDILRIISRKENEGVRRDLFSGNGLDAALLDSFFAIFGIKAIVDWDGESVVCNPDGVEEHFFKIEGDHMSHPGTKVPGQFASKIHESTLRASRASLKALEMCGNVITYKSDLDRATRIATNLLEGSTGALSSELYNGKKYLLSGDEPEGLEKKICGIFGTFGAGKSTLFKKFLTANLGKSVCFVSPRKSLAEDIRENLLGHSAWQKAGKKMNKLKAGTKYFKVHTFEVFLHLAGKLPRGTTILVDELQLYPPGYLDLMFHLIPEDSDIFLVGDPCQSDYDSEKDRVSYQGVKPDIEKLLSESTYKYNILSRRFRNNIYKGRLPCNFDPESLCLNERYLLATSMDEMINIPPAYKNVFLVSSFEEKKIVRAGFPQGFTVLTFGESTGRTFSRGTILITTASSFTNDKRWLTALSRFSDNLCLLLLAGGSLEMLAEQYQGRALGRFLCEEAETTDLLEVLPGKPIFTQGFGGSVGKSQGQLEEKLMGDPWLKSELFLGQDADVEEVEEALAEEAPFWFKTHIPRCELESVRASWVHKIMSKESREKRKGDLVSNQFTDEHSKNRGMVLTNAAERFETIYPRHRSNDTVTFLMAVRKRLRFSHPIVESEKLRSAELYGPYLLEQFLKKVPLKPSHNHQMMADAQRAFELKKTSKSAATIANHSGRSCRDWLADVGLIFSKSQICTKFDNRFRDAKAAQTIVCFQHAVLCRFAPYMRYLEMKLHEVLPPNFYIHSGKGLEELNDWVIAGGFDGVCTESDYEAFDASQDQYIVAFELSLMRFMGLPRDLIEDYRYIKTHLGSKLGSLAIMRFSGEASTFLFNTMANMLFTFMRYDLNGRESICFAGDDMCASRRLRLSEEHASFLNKLKLKAKVDFTRTPTFCGWNLSPDGIFKKPQLVLERMCIAKETNNLRNCIDNYAIEVSYAYRLGERAVNRMSAEELESYYNCVRIIIKNKHLLKSDVKKIFEENSAE